MVSQNVNQIYQAVQALTDAEKEQLRHLLETRAKLQPDSSLEANSRASELADEQRQKHRRRDFQPIELPGGPLSDDIIRDRR